MSDYEVEITKAAGFGYYWKVSKDGWYFSGYVFTLIGAKSAASNYIARDKKKKTHQPITYTIKGENK